MHEILCLEAFDDNFLAQTTPCISHGTDILRERERRVIFMSITRIVQQSINRNSCLGSCRWWLSNTRTRERESSDLDVLQCSSRCVQTCFEVCVTCSNLSWCLSPFNWARDHIKQDIDDFIRNEKQQNAFQTLFKIKLKTGVCVSVCTVFWL